MNEKRLKLFTKVEEGLPEEAVLCYSELNDEYLFGYLHKEHDSYYFVSTEESFLEDVSHYLHLSKLTTKEMAIEFAYEAVEEEKSM